MTLNDFTTATSLFPGKITAFLQGGLSVTGSWEWLNEAQAYPPTALYPNGLKLDPTSIIITDGNGARHVVPVEAITSLREVQTWTKRSPDAILAKPKKETIG